MTHHAHGSARMAPDTRSAPDYTTATLVMGSVNLLWIFTALWAAFGFGAVLLLAYSLHVGIEWLRRRRR